MAEPFINRAVLARFEELIIEGEKQWLDFQKEPGVIKDPMRYTQWATSCLNLLDKLSVTSNRFVNEFELWAKRGAGYEVNIGASLGVLKAACEEYKRGFAIDYHLSVSSVVFSDLLSQAQYLREKGYPRAAAVIAGAALEEGIKAMARALGIEIGPKDTLTPVTHKLKSAGSINEFESKSIEALGDIRNKAAHGGDFNYTDDDVNKMLEEVAEILKRIFSRP